MTEFLIGDVYFRLVFPDPHMKYPMVESFVFVGKNLSYEDQEEVWYFQFIEDYAEYGSVAEDTEGERRVSCETKETVSCMLDIEGLKEELTLAKRRRNNNQGHP